MSDGVYFDGDPATDSARRHMERVLKGEPSPRWPWLVAALGSAGQFLLPRGSVAAPGIALMSIFLTAMVTLKLVKDVFVLTWGQTWVAFGMIVALFIGLIIAILTIVLIVAVSSRVV